MNKILLIEDDEYIRDALSDLLGESDVEVIAASNGQEGIDYLRSVEELPRLVLLDLMMPIMDGYAFRAEQTGDPRLEGLPVVVMTADSRLEASKATLRADGYLKKPLDIDVVLATVARYCA